jgi:hypothetical protein
MSEEQKRRAEKKLARLESMQARNFGHADQLSTSDREWSSKQTRLSVASRDGSTLAPCRRADQTTQSNVGRGDTTTNSTLRTPRSGHCKRRSIQDVPVMSDDDEPGPE